MKFVALVFVLLFAVTAAFMNGANLGRRMSRFSLEMKSTGTVKFFDSVKGFGFITPEGGGEDVFVHQTAIFSQGFRSLAEGETVEYELSEDKSKGKKFATNVTGPNGSYVQGAPRKERNDSMRY